MTIEEIKAAYDKVESPLTLNETKVMLRGQKKPAAYRKYNRPSEDWRILFDFYNANSGQHHVGMGCQPCFMKVYLYIREYLKTHADTKN